ncbi:multiple monosaccharide ABC transporter ATP-binding protein [Bacillus changyiensis]|uniref:multiple monosaccharide ABC transporter ATP-binding protein n=1 Tax=Bacillus changyiensis TaxID=3004103 RepID=UPI0022E82487|nr:multiple monosaccharide ABC transporter ATP-binding protein [Bacillus changyiensis]MDA1477879.1 sugar ABC transporter ATP-binding protein [Bacillus changyiensis]
MSDVILEMKGITKEFPGVKALDNVHLCVKEGEIHALCGENGAGKSTLMKVLSGVYPHGTYTGDILYKGTVCRFKNIRQSEEAGIVIIHQELALVPQLSIAENLFLGNEQAKNGVIDWRKTKQETVELMKMVGLRETSDTLISEIGVGKQQLTEIAKALAKKVQLLILDEPTAALNEADSENLLQLLLELKKQGITSIMISHKLNEITKIADSITVLRDGQTIETLHVQSEQLTENRIIKGMVGRELQNRYPHRNVKVEGTVFEVDDWSVDHPFREGQKVVKNVSLSVRKGEIVGIAGLMGSGRTELAMSIFGQSYGRNMTGTLKKNGQELRLRHTGDAIKKGIVYVTEDRKGDGLILMNNIKENMTLAKLEKVSRRMVLNQRKETIEAETFRQKLNIKTPHIDQQTGNLSGGNQQKVMLSKWIFAEPDVLILDEPTRGIDVGAKYEIYTIMNQLALDGKAVIMISSELPELLGMCDRVYTMCEGTITAEFTKDEANQELLMKYMTMHTKKGEEGYADTGAN